MAQDERTLVYQFQRWARETPEMEAFVSLDENMVRRVFTIKEFCTLCSRLAYLLKEDGVKPGDYVVTTVPLCLESALVTFGILWAGAIPTNLDITLSDGEAMMQCFDKVKPRHMIIQDEDWSQETLFFRKTMKLSVPPSSIFGDVTSSRCPETKRVMMVRRSESDPRSLVELLRASTKEYVYEKMTRNTIGWLAFTTGTETDYLRLTEYTHGNIVSACEIHYASKKSSCRNRLYENPFFWVSSLPYDIVHGKTRVVPDKWSLIVDYPRMLVRLIKTEGVEQADLQPIHVIEMIKLLDEYNGGKPLLEVLECGGQPMTRSCMKALRPLAKRFTILYGSHETILVSMNRLTAEEIDNFQDFDNGEIADGVQVKLIDSDGREVPEGGTGRLLAKSAALFCGYPCQPARTASRMSPDGFFMSYDQGRIDPITKHLHVGCRIDTIILHGQYMFYPSLIENQIAPHPAVKQVVSVPVPDPVLFHGVGIAIIRHTGVPMTEQDVVSQLMSDVVPGKRYMLRPKIISFFDTLPCRPDGSVDRSKVIDILTEKCLHDGMN